MTPTETVQLVALVRATFPTMRLNDHTPDAWYDTIGHLGFDECHEATRRLARRASFISIADICGEVEAIRGEQATQTFDQGPTCGQGDCRCTHQEPCDRGMVESIQTPGAYAWCPTCWPHKQPEPGETREQWLHRLRTTKKEDA